MRIDPTSLIGRAERLALGRPTTLRDPSRLPIDVLIENLSETGALLKTEGKLPVGTLVSLGVAGAGVQIARIVRQAPGALAAEFVLPLAPETVAQARSAETLVSVAIPQLPLERATPAGDDAPRAAVLSLPTTPLPTPHDVPLTYTPVSIARPVVDAPEPDARAVWMPAERPAAAARSLPLASWLLVGAVIAAALVALVLI